jgi:hypothetical protein
MTRNPQTGHPEDLQIPAVAPSLETTHPIDEALLTEARTLLGGSGEAETINQALADLIQDRRRRQAAEAQLVRYQAGEFAQLSRPGVRP